MIKGEREVVSRDIEGEREGVKQRERGVEGEPMKGKTGIKKIG